MEKHREYRTIPTLTHYVMIEQDEIAATILERRAELWISRLVGPADAIDLPEIGITMLLAELYEGLEILPGAREEDG